MKDGRKKMYGGSYMMKRKEKMNGGRMKKMEGGPVYHNSLNDIIKTDNTMKIEGEK